MKLVWNDFLQAHELLTGLINPTPLVFNEWLSQQYQANIYLKLENMLPVGSFKLRGATYKLSCLSDKQKKQGVIAVSAGNHAQGVAWASKKFGIKATIVMPVYSPLTKIEKTESLGARVILAGESIEESFEFAEKWQKENDLVFIHPYKDPQIIAGQGSLGFELIQQLPDLDYVFSSIGGGGLVTGLGTVLKRYRPEIQVLAGQALGCSSMVHSLQAHKLSSTGDGVTFADGIRVKKADRDMYKALQNVVDVPEKISDDELSLAVVELLEKAHVVAEGAGALPLALLKKVSQKKSPLSKNLKGKNVVLVICGGNIDVNLLERVIDKGRLLSRKLIKLRVPITDKPGALHQITGIILQQGGNILEVLHDRRSRHMELNSAAIELTLELKNAQLTEKLTAELKKKFPGTMIME